jgi:hypothetical protein
MVAQAVMDVIVDLAGPVVGVHGDLYGDLELDVLTEPTVEDTKGLHFVITEINQVLNLINPIATLITALRDHEIEPSPAPAAESASGDTPTKAAIISPQAFTYFWRYPGPLCFADGYFEPAEDVRKQPNRLDIQHPLGVSEQYDETANICHHHFPATHLHFRILWSGVPAI